MSDQKNRGQASEVHETTGDADSAPTGAADTQSTREQTGHGRSPTGDDEKLNPDTGSTHVISDESDDGGPVAFSDEQDAGR